VRQIIAAAVLLVTVAGCTGVRVQLGQDDEAEGLRLAREVCQSFQAAELPAKNEDITAFMSQVDSLANTAGKAARLDGTWDGLAAAIASAAASAQRALSAVAERRDAEAAGEGTLDHDTAVRKALSEVFEHYRTARAECRKTT
jgi:hypothetical protein